MSRHRNVRSMNYTDEYDGYDDVYGHSVEDDYCISPSDAAFIYDRDGTRGSQKISAFFKSDDDIAEEDETVSTLDDVDKARLDSVLTNIKSVLDVSKIPENELLSLILKQNFDTEKIIDIILKAPKFIQSEKPEVTKQKDLINNCPSQNIKCPISSNNAAKQFEIPKLFGNTIDHSLFVKVNQNSPPNRKFDIPNIFHKTTNSSLLSNSPQTSDNSLFSKINQNSPPTKKFDIPNIFNKPNSSLLTNSPKKTESNDSSSHSSLSSFVSSYLGNSTLTEIPKQLPHPSFNLPFNNPDSLSNQSTPKVIKQIAIDDEILNSDWHIDLTNALQHSTKPVTKTSKKLRHADNEVFIPKFIDVDISSDKSIPLFCQIDLSNLRYLNSEIEKDVSRFGKIITNTYRFRTPNIPFTGMDYKPTFKFQSPSPDDEILKHFARK